MAGRGPAIGRIAYEKGSSAVRKLFGPNRRVSDLHFDAAVESLAADSDENAKRVRRNALTVVAPAIQVVNRPELRPYCR